MANIAINGFGRIGRLFLKRALEDKSINVVAINDLGNVDNLAYLLKYDTVYGKFPHDVSVDARGDKKYLIVKKKKIRFLNESDPLKLPWKELKIDVVLEATGAFESFEKSSVHCLSGAKRVVITAPAKDADGVKGKTVLVGINEEELKGVKVSSNGSCTTNATSPVIKIIDETIGIEKAILNTVHGYTATQTLVDSPVKGKDFRRGRAGAQNIIPSTTGAALAVGRAIKNMNGKFDGVAIRVPVPSGSVADITMVTKRNTTVEEINDMFIRAEKSARWKGILKTEKSPIVSSDILGEPYGAIIDLEFTKVVGGNLVKILSWYDNEAGYVSTLVRHVKAAGKSGL